MTTYRQEEVALNVESTPGQAAIRLALYVDSRLVWTVQMPDMATAARCHGKLGAVISEICTVSNQVADTQGPPSGMFS